MKNIWFYDKNSGKLVSSKVMKQYLSHGDLDGPISLPEASKRWREHSRVLAKQKSGVELGDKVVFAVSLDAI